MVKLASVDVEGYISIVGFKEDENTEIKGDVELCAHLFLANGDEPIVEFEKSFNKLLEEYIFVQCIPSSPERVNEYELGEVNKTLDKMMDLIFHHKKYINSLLVVKDDDFMSDDTKKEIESAIEVELEKETIVEVEKEIENQILNSNSENNTVKTFSELSDDDHLNNIVKVINEMNDLNEIDNPFEVRSKDSIESKPLVKSKNRKLSSF